MASTNDEEKKPQKQRQADAGNNLEGLGMEELLDL